MMITLLELVRDVQLWKKSLPLTGYYFVLLPDKFQRLRE